MNILSKNIWEILQLSVNFQSIKQCTKFPLIHMIVASCVAIIKDIYEESSLECSKT